MKRSNLLVKAADGGFEIMYYYNGRRISVIPIGNEPQVIESAEILAAQFNAVQPEE